MVRGWVRIATAGSQLRDTLNTDVQGFQLRSDDALRHTPTQFLHQTSRTAVLWDREGFEILTVFPVKGPQHIERGSETVGGLVRPSDRQGRMPATRRGSNWCH